MLQVAMMKAIEDGKDPSHLEVKLKPTASRTTPMELSIYIHVKHSITGEVDSIMLMCRDLTSQKVRLPDFCLPIIPQSCRVLFS